MSSCPCPNVLQMFRLTAVNRLPKMAIPALLKVAIPSFKVAIPPFCLKNKFKLLILLALELELHCLSELLWATVLFVTN